MSDIVKKCPKDGIVYSADFAGACESCFTPLKFYCKVHSEWLEANRCPKCDTGQTPDSKGGLWFVVLLIGCLILFAASITVIWRVLKHRESRPPATLPQPVVHVTPPPKPQPPVAAVVYPPVELTISQILADPDRYLGKLVSTTGVIQFADTSKATFDLRQGDYSVQVQYAGISAPMKSAIPGASSDQKTIVVGVLKRDNNLNALYLVAQRVDLR